MKKLGDIMNESLVGRFFKWENYVLGFTNVVGDDLWAVMYDTDSVSDTDGWKCKVEVVDPLDWLDAMEITKEEFGKHIDDMCKDLKQTFKIE